MTNIFKKNSASRCKKYRFQVANFDHITNCAQIKSPKTQSRDSTSSDDDISNDENHDKDGDCSENIADDLTDISTLTEVDQDNKTSATNDKGG